VDLVLGRVYRSKIDLLV